MLKIANEYLALCKSGIAENKTKDDSLLRFISGLNDPERIRFWETMLEDESLNRIKNDMIRDYYLMNNLREKTYSFCPTCKTPLVRKTFDRRKLLSCPECGFVFWNNPKPSTCVIIQENGKYLLLKRNKAPLLAYWVPPGGYIDYEETPQQAAIREAKEESGLDIQLISIVDVHQIDGDPSGMNLNIVYYAKVIGGRLAVNEESSEAGFFSIDELPRLMTHWHKRAILHFDSNKPHFLKKTIYNNPS